MDFSLLADLKEFLSVERHTPGHLCLKVDLAVRNHPAAEQLKKSAKNPAITSTRFNLFSRTLTVEYDSSTLSYDILCEMFACPCPDRCRELACQLTI